MEKVYDSESLCCGCGLCTQICSQHAIEMKLDKYGFLYPFINQKKCIDCGLCRKMCSFNNSNVCDIKECYAGVNNDKRQIKESASGGMFSALATTFIKNGGCVCGASLTFSEGVPTIKHEMIFSLDDLKKLQGSKYVQSNIRHIFEQVLGQLNIGKRVFFSGTPCQVAAMKAYAGSKYEELLYTVDIICHGVPNQKIFCDYIQLESDRRRGQIKKYRFRDKSYGWGLEGSIESEDFDGKISEDIISPDCSSYYRFFLAGEIYRECCYQCPFAQKQRVGDLTIGDYWGVKKYSPELMKENGGDFTEQEGVSCLMVNTSHGQKLLDKCGTLITKSQVEVSKVAIINTQLKQPAIHTELRKRLLESYADKGYIGIEKIFIKHRLVEKISRIVKIAVKKIIPQKMYYYIKKQIKGRN